MGRWRVALGTTILEPHMTTTAAVPTHTIESKRLRLAYQSEGALFSISERAANSAFVHTGRLEGGGGEARVEAATDAVFGAGQRIVIRQRYGSEVALELYDSLPFALLRKTLRNPGRDALDIPFSVVTTFLLDLGVPAAQLKTLGTGGLETPDKNPGSYVFLACANPATRRGVVAGWLTHERGSGVMFARAAKEQVEFKAQIDYGHLRIPVGASAQLETLAIGVFDDAREGLEQFADAVKRQYAINLRPQQATYCTWYAEKHGGAGDEASTIELARFIEQELKEHGLRVIQIDDLWQDGPKLDGPARGFERVRPDGPYPRGFGRVAQELAARGLVLGLWWLPFGRNHEDPAWRDRQDWFARWADGTPMRTASFGGTCLDLTHPEVRAHLAALSKMYREWGVTYFKMDGLWTGTATELTYINDGYKDDHMHNIATVHDPAITQIEAYRNGLKLIREHAGDDVFFSGCAMSQNMRSFGASFGLVDAMRIGPDFNHDKLGIKTGPIRASRLYFLNGRVWWNDPDPAKVRASDEVSSADSNASGAVSLDIARLTTSFTAITGQFFLLSDWLPNLPPERVEILKRTMLAHEATVRPIDYFDNFLPTMWRVTDDRSGARRDVLGLFNWEKTVQHIGCSFEKAELQAGRAYHAFDFWNNTLLPDIRDAFVYELPPESCRMIALRASEDRPVVLSTSRHITQGIVDIVREEWSDRQLSGVSRVIANDPYELRIRVPQGWTFDAASADEHATAHLENGLVRVRFTSAKSRDVAWRVSFR